MTSIWQLALGAALGAAALAAVQPRPVQAAAPARTYNLSKEERAALLPLQTAVRARDSAAAAGALPVARAGAKGADARYLYGTMLLRLGRDTNSRELQMEGTEAILVSGLAPQTELARYYGLLANLALDLNEMKKAENALSRLVELSPNDADALLLLGDLRSRQKRPAEAFALFERAIQLRTAANQPVPESWYKIALKTAFDAGLGPQTVKAGRALLAAYPSAENWRDVILDYRDVVKPPRDIEVDALRLLRAARALAGERDYEMLARLFNDAGLPVEANAVLQEGVEAQMVDAAKAPFSQLRTTAGARAAKEKRGLAAAEKAALAAASGAAALAVGDTHFGAGDFAKAATLYRAALEKGSVDTDMVNTRLAMALGLSGQAAEAQAVLQTVAGPRTDLASLLQVWLSQSARG